MKDINKCFSSNFYIYIPTKNNPKVILAVDNKKIKDNSFKLYNPFSIKAKLFKLILRNLCNLQLICNKFRDKYENSIFIEYLNRKFGKTFISSIYISTEKDKLVLQLQTDNEIFGYVKYPLNDVGKERIFNEKKAIEILSKLNVVNNYLIFDYFERNPFIVLKPLDGIFSIYNKEQILMLLKKFKRNGKFKLKDHPRIKYIAEQLKYDKIIYSVFLEIINKSTNFYNVVYEHGDFAPWNIMKNENKFIVFDFEYFEEIGLEWLDFIKYYYQIGRLLNKYKGKKLINFVFQNFDINEKEIIFQVFLFKEIAIKIREKKSFKYELILLKTMGVI